MTWEHTPDYRAILWEGQRFCLSKRQGDVIGRLHAAGREIHQETIIAAVGSFAGRLAELFRTGDGKRAWGTLVVPGKLPGTYRLAVDGAMPHEPTELERLRAEVVRLKTERRRGVLERLRSILFPQPAVAMHHAEPKQRHRPYVMTPMAHRIAEQATAEPKTAMRLVRDAGLAWGSHTRGAIAVLVRLGHLRRPRKNAYVKGEQSAAA